MSTLTHATVILLLDSARGQYIPKNFVEDCEPSAWGISPSDIDILGNPEGEDYWDTWARIIDNAERVLDGQKFTLHHDGDLWAFDRDNMSAEEKSSWGFDAC